MKKWILCLCLCLIVFSANAEADSLFYDRCATGSGRSSLELQMDEAPLVFVSSGNQSGVMSCQNVRAIFETTHIVGMALMPASLLLQTPGAREQIMAGLAAYGLTLANPAVLGVTVIGAFGVTTIYFVMRQSLRECERQEREALKRELLRELGQTYPGAQSQGNVSLQLTPERR